MLWVEFDSVVEVAEKMAHLETQKGTKGNTSDLLYEKN